MGSERFILAGIEGGGTKFNCAIADASTGRLIEEQRFATRAVGETLADVTAFVARASALHGTLAGVGIGCFGPLSLDPAAANYGAITSTSKPGWSGARILEPLASALKVPVTIETDVNGAALGELRFGAGRGLSSLAYITVGTGIGVGAIVDGRILGGKRHPEAGHMLLPHVAGDLDFDGICPFHGACAEGLASGPAMAARWGMPAETLPHDHPGWALEAEYLGRFCTNLDYTLRPERIVLGGGVMAAPTMIERVRMAYVAAGAGYDARLSSDALARFIVAPQLGSRSGVYGALALAADAAGVDCLGWNIGSTALAA